MSRIDELTTLLCEIRDDVAGPAGPVGPDSFSKLPGLIRELKEKANKYDELKKALAEMRQDATPAPSFTVGSRVRWESRGDSGFGTVHEIGTSSLRGYFRVQCDVGGTHWFHPDCLTSVHSIEAAATLAPADDWMYRGASMLPGGPSKEATPSTGHAEQWMSWLQELRDQSNGAVADLIASRVNTLMGHMPPDWPFDRAMHWAFTRAVKMVRTLDRRHVPDTPNERKTLGIRLDRLAASSAEKRFPPGTLVRWTISGGHYRYGEVVRVTSSPGQVIVHVQEAGVGPTIPFSPSALSEVPRVGSRVIVQCSNGRQLRGQVETARTNLGSVTVRGDDGWCCDFALGMIELDKEPDKEKP